MINLWLFLAVVVSVSAILSVSPNKDFKVLGVVSDGVNSETTSLRYGFYSESCPDAEVIVWNAMARILDQNNNATAQLLRLLFHDCFIEGCDASVLLDDRDGSNDSTSERHAIPNKTLKGFSFIDMIKEELENACPGVVSCADILVLSVRDGIAMSGGPYYPVSTGRRDRNESFLGKANAEIPRPMGVITDTLRLFSLRGFTAGETVTLLGGHNIGQIGCQFIRPRLNNFNETGLPDPSIPSDFIEEMRHKCPDESSSVLNIRAPTIRFRSTRESGAAAGSMSYTAKLVSDLKSLSGFDNHYYKSLLNGRGILFVDQQLMANEETAEAVLDYATSDVMKFRVDFARVMIKMSNLKVLTGLEGQVRRNCSVPLSPDA